MFSEEHSLDEPTYVEFSEVSPHIELVDPFSNESSSVLGPAPPISSLFSPLPIFLRSLDPPESTFIESETSVLGSPCLNQNHFEEKDLTLGRPLSFDFHVALDWPCLDPFPCSFRDVGFYFNHSDHSQWSLHSYSHIFVRPLTSACDFTYTNLSSN